MRQPSQPVTRDRVTFTHGNPVRYGLKKKPRGGLPVVFTSCTVLFLITIFILCGKKNRHGWPKCPFKPRLYPGMVEAANTYENGCNRCSMVGLITCFPVCCSLFHASRDKGYHPMNTASNVSTTVYASTTNHAMILRAGHARASDDRWWWNPAVRL